MIEEKDFIAAKLNDNTAISKIFAYFMHNVERELNLLNINKNIYQKKWSMARRTILNNIYCFFEYDKFMKETFKDILYLNKGVNSITSKEIVTHSLPYIRSRIVTDLDKVKLPIIYRECARLYYVSNMTPDELAIMYKCSVALIYKRLRMVANAIFVSNYGNNVNNAI